MMQGSAGGDGRSLDMMQENAGGDASSFGLLEGSIGGNGSHEQQKMAGGENTLVAYVDGSYYSATGEFSYGVVILYNGLEYYFNEKMSDPELAAMHNVAGEIKGAEAAMRYAVEHGYSQITIYHDYEGIARWCTGDWKANKSGTQAYKAYYDSISDRLQVRFEKVKGHSGDKYNDMADRLAKQALGL
ncbi:MAG: reverse transcriptase-like protein [Lachnospiraceae bacterium]|nr:reverse transcriptase-like protein [Lachnospiraceae bacterium]